MLEKHLFEYAVIRVVPRVEREEFLNAGVILFCKKAKFLKAKFHLQKERIHACCSDVDLQEIEKQLRSFERICAGSNDGGPIAELDAPSRFRWLTATRSTIVQTSKVHPGFCINLEETLERLHQQLVL